jgi:hypothetical protein
LGRATDYDAVSADGGGPDGRTALKLAAMFNRTAIVDLLLARGADPKAQGASGKTDADCAAARGAGHAGSACLNA